METAAFEIRGSESGSFFKNFSLYIVKVVNNCYNKHAC